MKVIELFSGSGDITKALKSKGINAVSVDYDPNMKSDIIANVYELPKRFLSKFDFIWASPDCTTYSLAAHGLHRIKGGVAVSDYAKQCDKNNEKFVKILKEINIPFIIENPRGFIQKMPWVEGLHKVIVYYSQYGTPYSKPTVFLSNRDISRFFDQTKKPTGKHLDYCKSYENFLGRCKIPDRLIDDIVKAIEVLAYER